VISFDVDLFSSCIELAEVFFQKLFLGLMSKGALGTVIGFAGFFGATFAVLLSMDVLECFLHALRLHWVRLP
jgi:V-type H+-transporting ATPase subunit a